MLHYGAQINVGKSEGLVDKKNHRESCEKVRLSGEEMKEVYKFKY